MKDENRAGGQRNLLPNPMASTTNQLLTSLKLLPGKLDPNKHFLTKDDAPSQPIRNRVFNVVILLLLSQDAAIVSVPSSSSFIALHEQPK